MSLVLTAFFFYHYGYEQFHVPRHHLDPGFVLSIARSQILYSLLAIQAALPTSARRFGGNLDSVVLLHN